MAQKVYAALLRGINVGGNNKVSMAELKACFEAMGFGNVKTYINSGNVIFSADSESQKLANQIESALKTKFGFNISVVVKDLVQMAKVVSGIPKKWYGDDTLRRYIMFLRPSIDKPSIMDGLKIRRPDIEEVTYVPGAILWSAKISELTHSDMVRLASSAIYKEMTIRNLSTTLKVYELMRSAVL